MIHLRSVEVEIESDYQKLSIENFSSRPVRAACAAFPRLITNAPRTENHSLSEMFSDSRDSSCVPGCGCWSGRGTMNPCLASLEIVKVGCNMNFVQIPCPFLSFSDRWCTSRTSLGCRPMFGGSFLCITLLSCLDFT
jgi:hypothetical protein